MDSKKPESGRVISLKDFRSKKSLEEDFADGRTPLFVSHLDGKIKGSPHLNRGDAEDFGDRLTRIRSSLERINKLMTDIKKTSGEAQKSSKLENVTTLH